MLMFSIYQITSLPILVRPDKINWHPDLNYSKINNGTLVLSCILCFLISSLGNRNAITDSNQT